jgi:hypothetical protein
VVELRKQTAQCAQRASRPAVRHAQSLFGSFRRTYAPVLQQHPSLPVDLHKLRLDMERALSTSSPPQKSLDIVLTRCMDSISPAFRVLPAALTDLGHVRAKAVVFERCAPGQHLGELPTLDARDRILRVRRLVLRSNKTRTRQTDATTTGAGATDEIYPYMPAAISSYVTSSSGDEADLVLFLFPAGASALASAPPAKPLTHHPSPGAKRRFARRGGNNPESNQQEMQRQLREQWATIATPIEGWTRADGTSAMATVCIAKALKHIESPRRASKALLITGADGSSASSPLALLATRGALTNAASADSGGAWAQLLSSAPHFRCSASRTAVGRMCRAVLDSKMREAGGPLLARTSPPPRGPGGWPDNVSHVGFCGVTNEGVEGDCARGDSGSWNTRVHRVRTFADCVGRCVLCARCSYVTYSPDNDDCSWYSHKRCNLRSLGRDDAFRTVQVARAARRTASDVSMEPQVSSAHLNYLCGMRADRRWAKELLRGSLLVLLRELAELALASELRPALPGGNHALLAPLVHPACVENDFMLHNRQLLPSMKAPAGGTHPCIRLAQHSLSSHLAAEAAGSSSSSAAGARRWVQSQAPPLEGEESLDHAMPHGEALGALTSLIRHVNAGSSAAGCNPRSSAKMELHLSGFFSMVASVLKPWTAALRLRRSLLTPTAPGLFDHASCPQSRQASGQVDWGCHFERIGPPACDTSPASQSAARILFNLPEQHRESMTDAHSLPQEFRHLGSFWWVSQLTQRLMRPRGRARAMLRAGLRDSGLGAALVAQRPIIGMHVRHGDACIASERARTVRTCEPLAEYMKAIADYAMTIGAKTIFLATDSERVLADARRDFPQYTFLHIPNVSRTGLQQAAPTTVLDEVIKERARTGKGVAKTERDALLGAVDALLLARCDVLVGKFSSGLFRAAYALAAARRGGALLPFVSLDAPWCADHAVPAGYNDNFPRRSSGSEDVRLYEQIRVDSAADHTERGAPAGGGAVMLSSGYKNVFLC